MGPSLQFKDRARIRAVEVLPVPRTPANRKAWWWMEPDSWARFRALARARTLASWPTRSESRRGRYLSARVVMEGPLSHGWTQDGAIRVRTLTRTAQGGEAAASLRCGGPSGQGSRRDFRLLRRAGGQGSLQNGPDLLDVVRIQDLEPAGCGRARRRRDRSSAGAGPRPRGRRCRFPAPGGRSPPGSVMAIKGVAATVTRSPALASRSTAAQRMGIGGALGSTTWRTVSSSVGMEKPTVSRSPKPFRSSRSCSTSARTGMQQHPGGGAVQQHLQAGPGEPVFPLDGLVRDPWPWRGTPPARGACAAGTRAVPAR